MMPAKSKTLTATDTTVIDIHFHIFIKLTKISFYYMNISQGVS